MSPSTGAHARRGRPEAAMVVWRWRDEESLDSRPGEARAARVRGLLQSSFGLAVGALVYGFVSPGAGIVIGSVASVILACALLSPLGLFARIEAVFRWIGHGIGVAVTWLTLGLLFFGFFLPFGLLFRRGRKDGMKRFYVPEAESYWTAREAPAEGVDAYRRQF